MRSVNEQAGPRAPAGRRLPAFLDRLLAIADEPTDDDDERLRKRFGVTAGYISVIAPLSVVGEAGERLLAVPLGLSLTLICIANLAALARTHRFDRYVVVLISAGTIFTVLAIVMAGGVAAAGSAMLWASRMESSGVPGRIQVAQSTRELLRDSCTFEERGPVDVKGLGRMTTYLIGPA